MTETLRDGRFVQLGSLGEGSQGHTYDGVDKREGRPVAIKRFDVRGARAWKDVELAEREARVLASLSHPSLPAYVDHFEEAGALFLVMEKIEGESLAAMKRRGARFDEAEVVRFLRDAAATLDYLHGRAPPVIHRDLKPGNVIRRPDGRYAFVDFGAVRDKLRPEGGSTVVGTFGFMAPEQFQGRALPGSDVYAIGATALSMLTGEDPEALPHRGLAIDVRRALGSRADPRLVEALERMLEPDPDRRADRIAPLLEKLGRRSGPATESRHRDERRERRREERDARRARRHDREWEEWAERGEAWGREWEAKAEKIGRRAEREARKAAVRTRRDLQRVRRGEPWPWPFSLVAMIGLTIATVAVAIALQVVVPILLTFLSLFFGRGLRTAAKTVHEAGERAVSAIGRARVVVQKGLQPERAEDAARVRVEQGERPQVRVAVTSDRGEDEAAEREAAEDEAEHEEGDQKRRRK